MYTISKTFQGKSYVAVADMTAGGVMITLNGMQAEKVIYSAEYRFYYAEYMVDGVQIWVTLFGKKITIAISDSVLSEEAFLNQYAKRAYSLFVAVLILMATVLIPSLGTMIIVTSITKDVSRFFMYAMIGLACFGFVVSTLYPLDWIKRRCVKGLLCILCSMLAMISYYFLPLVPLLF